MQRFGLRALTIVTLIVLILPAGSLATAAGSVEPFLEPAGAPYRIYLPMSAQAPTVPPAPANMVLVPAGTFRMGCDPVHNGGYECYSDELPLHTVHLDAYYIDRTEVTNAAYDECVKAGGCAASVYISPPPHASHPVIYVSWYQAEAYCRWAGKWLPTEAQWEKAARGASDTRAYPWGDEAPTCALANFSPNWPVSACVDETTPVGSYAAGASPYGALDMAGNVVEWVNDWYDERYYDTSPGSNPLGPMTGSGRVLRGGGYIGSSGRSLRVAGRGRVGADPTRAGANVGFRCVAAP